MIDLLSDPKSAQIIQMLMGPQHELPKEEEKALPDEDEKDAAMDNGTIFPVIKVKSNREGAGRYFHAV